MSAERSSPSHVLSSGDLVVRVRPDLGMTMTSIRRGAGPELLYCAPARRWRPRPAGLGPVGRASAATIGPLLLGGWFEMSPDAGFSPMEGSRRYYHGEAVRRAWTVLRSERAALDAAIRLDSAPLELGRRIEVDPAGVTVSSTIRNLGPAAVHVSPGEHPCFRRDVVAGGGVEVDGTWLDEGRPPVRIPESPDRSSGGAMVRVGAGSATLVAADGRTIAIDVDRSVHDRIGIWWTFTASGDGPAGWDCIALEPLSAGVQLEPGASLRSRTTVSLDARWSEPDLERQDRNPE